MRTFRAIRGFILPLLVFLVAANVLVAAYVAREEYVYFWDYSNHWVRTIALKGSFSAHPLQALREVVYGARHSDYNELGALLLLPWALLFGTSRMAFILGIVNMLALPAVIMTVLLVRSVAARHGLSSSWDAITPVFLVLTLPAFWVPILRGYVGVAGLVVMSVILLLYARAPLASARAGTLLALAFCLVALVVFHKWYAYWVACFFAALAFEGIVFEFPRDRARAARFALHLAKAAAIGLGAIVIFAVLALPLMKLILQTRYGDIFAYHKQSATPFHMFWRSMRYLGPLHVALFFGGALYLILRRKAVRLCAFLLFQFVAIVFLFARTQDFGSHHFYLLQPAMLLVGALVLADVAHSRLAFRAKAALAGAFAAAALGTMACVFVPGCAPAAAALSPALPTTRLYPARRGDMAELERMLQVLAERAPGDQDLVYVIAASGTFNKDIVEYAHLSLGRPKTFEDRILFMSGIDRWHGFPQNLFRARYVVVADPIQYHAKPEFQRVIGVPAECILKGTLIGSAYDRLPYEFSLDDGIRVYIYERMRPFRREDVRALSDIFKAYYPDRERLYRIECPEELLEPEPSA